VTSVPLNVVKVAPATQICAQAASQ
jgi:hypothetical protein